MTDGNLDDHNVRPWGSEQEMELDMCTRHSPSGFPIETAIGYNIAFYIANLPARVYIWKE